MTEQVLDVRTFGMAVRRRWPLLVAFAVAGGLAGAALAVAWGPPFVAQARVLYPVVATSSAAQRPIDTQVQVVRSSAVARRAGARLTPARSEEWVREHTDASASTDRLLRVRATGDSGPEVVALADALAEEYVAFASSETAARTHVTTSALAQRAEKLRADLRALDFTIGGLTTQLAALAQGTADAITLNATVETLRSQRSDLAKDLTGVETRINDAELEQALTVQGLQVLERARLQPQRTAGRTITRMTGGVLLGLLVGAAIALVREHVRRHVRTRDQLALAAGAPVVATADGPRRRFEDACCAIATDGVVFEPSLARALQAMVPEDRLGGRGAHVLALAAVGGDRGALAVTLEAAALLADSGHRTLLVEAVHGPLPFERVLDGLTDPHRPAVRANLSLKAAAPDTGPVPARGLDAADLLQRVVSERMRSRFDVIVAFVPFDGRSDAWPYLVGADSVLLAVSAGHADQASVRAVAERCGADGAGPDGVIVVDPDPADTTTGRGPARTIAGGGPGTRTGSAGGPAGVAPAVPLRPTGTDRGRR